jgi:hypothetical protein
MVICGAENASTVNGCGFPGAPLTKSVFSVCISLNIAECGTVTSFSKDDQFNSSEKTCANLRKITNYN